jgi:hypothetical protein
MGAPSPPSPAPLAGVHTSPRRPRATFAVHDPDAPPRPKHDDYEDTDQLALPYPRWFTILARTGLVGVDIGVLVVTVRFLNAWRGTPKFQDERYSLALAAAAVALFIDGLAVVMSLARRYGRWQVWTLSVIADVIIGVMGVVGWLMLAWVDHNGMHYEGWWEPDGYVVGTLALVVG